MRCMSSPITQPSLHAHPLAGRGADHPPPPLPPGPAVCVLVDTAPACWSSQALLGGAAEVHIRHGAALYRLRLTRQGKLILTK